MTTVYLAWGVPAHETLVRHAADAPVDLLVSAMVMPEFLKRKRDYNIRRWCMDSGAFSVQNSSAKMPYEVWRDAAIAAKAEGAYEIFGLDVIWDAVATRVNCERAWQEGIDAIPTFHWRSPWSELVALGKQCRKVALGGVALKSCGMKIDWYKQVFARVWPKRFHAFGAASQQVLNAMPFDSGDASSWCTAPRRFSSWCGLSGRQIKLYGIQYRDLWMEVVEHQRRAAWARAKWRAAFQAIEEAERSAA